MPTPLVIQCAITGSIDPDPVRRPNLPATPDAIVAEALAAWRAGAAVVHLHAREPDGTPTQDRDAYRALVESLREAGCEAIVNLSCGSAGGRAARDARLGPLELSPEMASFDAGSINFADHIFENDLPFLRRMAARFRERGVHPEVECFDSGHVGLALQLCEEGLLEAPLAIQFVLGVPGSGVPATVAMVEHLRGMIPRDWPWSVCAIGHAQLPLNTYCILAGGHVRTGLEDNLWFRRGERATNAMLVERVVRIAAELDRPVATPDEARAILRVG
ncbi:MAG TPA: 3-keto-5-aminohexanoate cleavage protein [Solirubrobacteraceae bacterium]|jgi:3-keto-5-aminohexanoate cleavage enzyme|nr:3-keto-5-aminohexanoate cleavage protein [Solirubrobacteraceae bacterium]